MSPQDAMDGRAGHDELVESLQVIGDLPGPEVVMLPQVEDLADDLRRRSQSPASPNV
jgi:hypothetical protein